MAKKSNSSSNKFETVSVREDNIKANIVYVQRTPCSNVAEHCQVALKNKYLIDKRGRDNCSHPNSANITFAEDANSEVFFPRFTDTHRSGGEGLLLSKREKK